MLHTQSNFQTDHSPHASNNPFLKLHSPRTEAFAPQKMVGRRNGRVITAEEIVDLISVRENVRSILIAYTAAHPSESGPIRYILRWRRSVLEEFAHLTGVELPATSQPENKPAQSVAAVTNISCRTCVHRDMFFERLPEVNVKCAKGYWPTQRYLTFERNKKRSQELASDSRCVEARNLAKRANQRGYPHPQGQRRGTLYAMTRLPFNGLPCHGSSSLPYQLKRDQLGWWGLAPSLLLVGGIHDPVEPVLPSRPGALKACLLLRGQDPCGGMCCRFQLFF